MKARLASLAVASALLLLSGCGSSGSLPAGKTSSEASADPVDKIWRVLGLNEQQIGDLKAKAEPGIRTLPRGSGVHKIGDKEIWELHENKPEVLKEKLEDMLRQFMEEMKDAPTYIQEGIKAFRQSQDDHAAEVEKALKSLRQDSGQAQT